MKMLVLVYHHVLDDKIRTLLAENDVRTFSEFPRVLGVGETGRVEDTRHSPGYNNCIFAALPEEKIEQLNRVVHELASDFAREYGRPMQLRAFSLPCEQLL